MSDTSIYAVNMESGYILTDFDLYKSLGVSRLSLLTFKETRQRFFTFVKATAFRGTDHAGHDREWMVKVIDSVTGRTNTYYPSLILEDNEGNKLALTGTSIGYAGEGPRALIQILNLAGLLNSDVNEITNAEPGTEKIVWTR